MSTDLRMKFPDKADQAAALGAPPRCAPLATAIMYIGNRGAGALGLRDGAQFYMLLESAKLAGVEPRTYLRAAAEAALAGRPPLLPH